MQLTWSHAREEDFPVLSDWKTRGAVPEFARTIDRKEPEPEAETSSTDGTDESDADVEVTEAERGGQSEAATSDGSGDGKRGRNGEQMEEADAKPGGGSGRDSQKPVENGLASAPRIVGDENCRAIAADGTQRAEHASKRQKQ